jgi:prevent-host-death family protein
MQRWPVQDAKNQFSRVVELATTDGPQTITRHGKDVAVVLAIEEFKKLNLPKETPLEFFSRLKGLNLDLKRRRELPRKMSL